MSNRRILFTVIAEKGHINPMIGIAQHLELFGYELAFFCQTDIAETLKQAGLKARTFFDHSQPSQKKFATTGKEFIDSITQKGWLKKWIKALLIDLVPKQQLLIQKVIEEFKPEIIVTDPMMYAAAIIAENCQLPWVGLSSSLNPITPGEWECDLTETLLDLNPLRLELFKTFKTAPTFKISDVISPWLNIVFATEEYMPRKVCKNDVSFYLGNSFPPFKRGDETDFPYHKLQDNTKKVYMSLGSQLYFFPQLFQAVAEALNEECIQLILAMNELIHTPHAKNLPKNVIAVSYAPQLELLQHVDLMITHGGANSVIESLSHGVPIAMFPLCNDQFLQSMFMHRAQVGVRLNPWDLSVESYKEQLLPLLDADSLMRQKAQVIGDSFKNYGGSFEGAKLIQKICTEKKPLSPILSE